MLPGSIIQKLCVGLARDHTFKTFCNDNSTDYRNINADLAGVLHLQSTGASNQFTQKSMYTYIFNKNNVQHFSDHKN